VNKSFYFPAFLLMLSSSAFAQSNVTLYGVADAGVTVFTGQTNGARKFAVDSGHLSPSRFGFKGVEVIDSDLSFRFALESTLFVDTGVSGSAVPAQTLFDRKAFGGIVSKKFGAIDLGRQTNLEFDAIAQVDPANASYTGANPAFAFGALNNASVYGTYGPNGAGAVVSRLNNSIKYTSPVISNFVIGAQHAAGEKTGNQQSYDGLSFAYSDGSLSSLLVTSQLRNAN
jgi:general bacterial porin, GBP family